jgi:nitrous oxidase accessory protein
MLRSPGAPQGDGCRGILPRGMGVLATLGTVLLVAPRLGSQPRIIVVDPSGPIPTITAALRMAPRGARIVVHRGIYREPTIVVDRPVTITGEGWPTLDGQGVRQILLVTADSVTITGLHFAHVGASFTEDRAAIRVNRADHCVIAGNVIDDAFFGIYLAGVSDCRIERNLLRGRARTQTTAGNGIHLWSSRRVTIVDNRIMGHRDGIYFEFVRESDIDGNRSERNLRYGLHFMFSDSCRYTRNLFRSNGAGVAVMYSRNIEMLANRFEANRGSGTYGLLLKEITDSRLDRNVFDGNTTAVLADGANRLVARENDFLENGWALRIEASSQEAQFIGNRFIGNTFDVTTNSREPALTFRGNYWDAYDGYDLDGNGAGDVPYRPIRLFSLIVARHEPLLVLLQSPLVRVLDAAERAFPALTPDLVVDPAPSMWRSR